MNGEPIDPDAIWKPGYSGGDRNRPSASGRPERDTQRPSSGTIGVLVAVAVAVLVVAGLAWDARRRDERPPHSAVPWSATFDTDVASALTSDPDVVVALVDRPNTLIGLDHRTGSERWRVLTAGAAATGLDVVDGVAIVRHVEADASGRAVAVDTSTGDILWSVALASGEYVAVSEGVVWRTRVRSSPDARAGGAVIDLRTGRPTGETGPHVDRAPHERLITQWGTDSFGARAMLETDLGSVEVIVDERAGVTTLWFIPASS